MVEYTALCFWRRCNQAFVFRVLTADIEFLQAKLKSIFGLEMVEIHYARQSKATRNSASQGELLVHLANNVQLILALNVLENQKKFGRTCASSRHPSALGCDLPVLFSAIIPKLFACVSELQSGRLNTFLLDGSRSSGFLK